MARLGRAGASQPGEEPRAVRAQPPPPELAPLRAERAPTAQQPDDSEVAEPGEAGAEEMQRRCEGDEAEIGADADRSAAASSRRCSAASSAHLRSAVAASSERQLRAAKGAAMGRMGGGKRIAWGWLCGDQPAPVSTRARHRLIAAVARRATAARTAHRRSAQRAATCPRRRSAAAAVSGGIGGPRRGGSALHIALSPRASIRPDATASAMIRSAAAAAAAASSR